MKLARPLERNFVVGWALRFGALILGNAARSAFATTGAASTASLGPPFAASADHLHAVGDNLELRALLAVGLPLFELEPSLDQHAGAFAEVFVGNFGSSPPERHIDERRFVDPLIVLLDPVVDRQPDIGDRSAAGDIAQLGVARQVAHQDDPIVTGHGRLLVRSFGFSRRKGMCGLKSTLRWD